MVNLIEANFTIMNMTNDFSLKSDIEKYSFTKALFKPFDNKNKNLDHMCFPHILPTGKGIFYNN